MSKFRFMLLSTAAVGLLAASPVSAGEVEKSMSVSGHVNRAIVIADDGDSTTVGQIDNTNVSGSRFRIGGSAKSESMTIKTMTELGVQANGGANSEANTSSTSINLRHSYISVGNDMGTLYVGHTWAADWLATSNSLSGTGNAGFYDGHTVGGETLQVKSDTDTTNAGVSVGTVSANYTGYRKTNVKYVTPDMGGFKAEVGFAENDRGAASIRYSGDFDGTKVVGTVAVGSRSSDLVEKDFGGSVAVGLAGGLNASLAYSKRDLSNNASNSGLKDPDMWAASVGYKMGANGITAWYQTNDDFTTNTTAAAINGNESETIAVVVQHNMADYGTTLYGGIQNTEFDANGTDYEDVTAGWVGIKVTF